MTNYIEYDSIFYSKNNWQIYFGFVSKYSIVYSLDEWKKFVEEKKLPEIYKKLTIFTLTSNIFILIPENRI